MTNEETISLINQRRRQVLVHSVIYYRLGKSIIEDRKWDEWAKELDKLQKTYPELLPSCWRNDIFSNFDPCSGYYLPLDDKWANAKARWLLKYNGKRQ